MTTPTTREQANRLLTAYEWIKDRQDVLPDGWELRADSGPLHVYWPTTCDQRAAAFAYLTHELGQGTEGHYAYGQRWIGWPAEGGRPRLTIYRDAEQVTA